LIFMESALVLLERVGRAADSKRTNWLNVDLAQELSN
jgi:hypothetical protein